MSKINSVISTSIVTALPEDTQERNLVFRKLERKAVRLGLFSVFSGLMFLVLLEISRDSFVERGQQAADDLFKKSNGTICSGAQQFSIDSSLSVAFSERIIALCEMKNN